MFSNKIIEAGGKPKFKGHNQYIKLNRSILDPAINWKLIKINGKVKGSTIELTEEGEKWIKIL